MHLDNLGMISQQIDSWLRKQIVLRDKVHGNCHHILLRHLTIDRKVQGDVASFSVKLEVGSEDINPLITSICEAAQQDADVIQSGIQNYALFAQYDDLNYMPRKMFRVAALNEGFERDLTPSEPPTEKGVLAQHMRFTEAMTKTTLTSVTFMHELLQRENSRLADQNEKYAEQQIDFMLVLQKLMDHSHERRLKEKEREFGVGLKQQALEKVSTLIPIIANRIAGKNVLPTTDPSFLLMADLLENLSPQQQMDMLEMLDPAQRILFGEMLAEYEKKKAIVSGTKPNLIAQAIGKKNGLPTSEAKQIEGSSEDNPTPMFESIEDKMKKPPTIMADDEVIQDMEQFAKDFASRFQETMKPAKKE
jgi:hypothetical protein